MIKHCLTVFVVLFVVVSLQSLASEIIKAKVRLQVEVDVACFLGDETVTYVEVYYGIPENAISYTMDSARYMGAVNMMLVVRNDSAVVAKKEWSVPHIIEDTAQLTKSQMMIGIETLGLPPGDYVLSLSAYDIHDRLRTDSLSFPLPIRNYAGGKETLSDIELCSSIQSSTNTSSIFYKNTFEMIPNPSRLYGIGLPILNYYLEVYSVASSSSQSSLLLRTTVTDAFGSEKFKKEKNKPRTLNSSVEVGTVNLSAFQAGTYQLQVSLVDAVTNSLMASTTKKFFVYRPDVSREKPPEAQGLDLASLEYVSMSKDELDKAFAQAQYIATDTERKQYEMLTDVKAKQKFLAEFWRRRDPDPQTPVNEYKEEYVRRLEFCSKNLGAGFREGWKTDRGRVYLVYGLYDEIERFPSSAESNPYEIWHYNSLQGGVIFVFVDRSGLGEYTLVHSTHRDELHETDWFRQYAQKIR
ncbi:MAG: GWxTD domain-containing protein [Ignavibacteriae bacterium]|nr:GWxTD domain-containing protein [Ignavibacteriota bacterium]